MKKKIKLIKAFWINMRKCFVAIKPFGLEHFSCEKKIQIELLELLQELKAPLKASPKYCTGLLNQTQVVMCSRLDVNPLARRW
jgi:hypothetical protein